MVRLFKPSGASKRHNSKSPSTPNSARSSKPVSDAAPSELDIIDLSFDGRGVAKYQAKTVFVAGALPSERVSVAHYRRQKRFNECEAKQILSPSVHRQSPFCSHYQECGGCQLQHLQPRQQILHKQQQLLNLLQRQHKITAQQWFEPLTAATQAYRSRVRFGVDSDGHLSFRAQGSDQLVAISACPVLEPAIEGLMAPLQKWLHSLPKKSGVTHVECFVGKALTASDGSDIADEATLSDSTLTVVRHTKPLLQKQRKALGELVPNCWFQGSKQGALFDSEGHKGSPELGIQLHIPLSFAQDTQTAQGSQIPQDIQTSFEQAATHKSVLAYQANNFSQVNRAINQKMVVQALQWLTLTDQDRVMDLFCGVGNFTLPLAQLAEHVIGVEAVEPMVVQGRRNAELACANNVQFLALDLESKALNALLKQQSINKVLLDPPRAGAKYVCEQLAHSSVSQILYVSCNPASFARDAAVLCAGGYQLQNIRLLDMFPNTTHVETMALFKRPC